MKKKPKLDDLDVVFDPTPLTEEEKKLISEFIPEGKAKRGNKPSVRQLTDKTSIRNRKKRKQLYKVLSRHYLL